jgi:hypothetical protein
LPYPLVTSQVKKASEAVQDHAKHTIAVATIEAARREAHKHRRRAVRAGTPEASLPPFDETLLAETRKAFADKEQRRRNYEKRMKAETVREAEEAAAEHEEMMLAHRSEQEWSKGRDQRMGNWASFTTQKRKRAVGDGSGTVLNDALRFGSKGSATAPEKDYKKRWR